MSAPDERSEHCEYEVCWICDSHNLAPSKPNGLDPFTHIPAAQPWQPPRNKS